MAAAAALLPIEFSDLEPFAPTWCLATETERFGKRMSSKMEEMQAFYDAAFPRLDEAKAYLDKLPIHDLPEDALNLLHLLFSLVMVSFPAEVWRQPHIPDTGAAAMTCWLEAPLRIRR
jgi:hypothetical protein